MHRCQQATDLLRHLVETGGQHPRFVARINVNAGTQVTLGEAGDHAGQLGDGVSQYLSHSDRHDDHDGRDDQGH